MAAFNRRHKKGRQGSADVNGRRVYDKKKRPRPPFQRLLPFEPSGRKAGDDMALDRHGQDEHRRCDQEGGGG